MVTLPHGLGWPSIHLTPPLHSYGYAGLVGALSPYQRLPFFYNTYLFSPPNYRFAHKNPYLTFLEENHSISSQKDLTLEKVDLKEINNIGKNKHSLDNSAAQTNAKFTSQKVNSEKIIKNHALVQKSVETDLFPSKIQGTGKITEEKLIALAQYNEKQKLQKKSNEAGKNTAGETKQKPTKLTQVGKNALKISNEQKFNPLKDQIESFGTETRLDFQQMESDLKNSKLVENFLKSYRTNPKLNESLFVNDVTLKKIQKLNEKLTDPNAAFFAPYKNHPLFTYLRDKHTLDFSKVIEYKTEDQNLQSEKDTVTLILKPMARAIAGLEGRAMATPLSRAVVEKGTNADILFEPDAVAIVGPGGIAHAQSELEVGYVV